MGGEDCGGPESEWKQACSTADAAQADELFAYVREWVFIEKGNEKDLNMEAMWEKWGVVAERLRQSLRREECRVSAPLEIDSWRRVLREVV